MTGLLRSSTRSGRPTNWRSPRCGQTEPCALHHHLGRAGRRRPGRAVLPWTPWRLAPLGAATAQGRIRAGGVTRDVTFQEPDGAGHDASTQATTPSTQALRSTRPGGFVGIVGVAHGVELPGEELFYSHVGLRGGPAPMRRFLPGLIDLVCNHEIEPGKVFDMTLPLEQVAEGYRAMDERRAIKTLLRP